MSYKKGVYINQCYKPDELLNKFVEYLEHCGKNKIKMPNIAGFAVFAGITKQTLYNYKHDERYKDAFDAIALMHEDSILNSKENIIMRIFYMKNKFDYVDKKEISTSNTNTNISLSEEERKALEERIYNNIIDTTSRDTSDIKQLSDNNASS